MIFFTKNLNENKNIFLLCFVFLGEGGKRGV